MKHGTHDDDRTDVTNGLRGCGGSTVGTCAAASNQYVDSFVSPGLALGHATCRRSRLVDAVGQGCCS